LHGVDGLVMVVNTISRVKPSGTPSDQCEWETGG
jgi:hypothetical protein